MITVEVGMCSSAVLPPLPRVNVLLSAYNGMGYIEEQIESVLSQVGVDVVLYIRDDGSTDHTLEIIERFQLSHPNISVFSGGNIGYVKSFFALLSNADCSADFFAFCDQDDIWLPEKLASAVELISGRNSDRPVMYFSRTEYVNHKLEHLAYSVMLDESRIGYKNALVQNVATGCTVVFNASARALVVSRVPTYCLVHDWWVYLVVGAFGEVIYDPRSFIRYRQHAGNAIGASGSFLEIYKRRIVRFFESKSNVRVSLQLAEFLRLYGTLLSEEKKSQLAMLAECQTSFAARFRCVLSNSYQRNSVVDNMLLKVVILIGRF